MYTDLASFRVSNITGFAEVIREST
ncbi:uncharacterized protein METZ01_LOCUS372362, partial [marine metagenome]